MQPTTVGKHSFSKPKVFLRSMLTDECFLQQQEGKCRGMGWQTWMCTDEKMAAFQRRDFMTLFWLLENYCFPILSSKKLEIQFFSIIMK